LQHGLQEQNATAEDWKRLRRLKRKSGGKPPFPTLS
jgi:hypothetical protein